MSGHNQQPSQAKKSPKDNVIAAERAPIIKFDEKVEEHIKEAFSPKQFQQSFLTPAMEGWEEGVKSLQANLAAARESYHLFRNSSEALRSAQQAAVNVAEQIGEQVMEYQKDVLSYHLDTSRELLDCHTMNDLLDWQMRLVKQHSERFCQEVAETLETLITSGQSVMEPLQQQLSEQSDQWAKRFTGACA